MNVVYWPHCVLANGLFVPAWWVDVIVGFERDALPGTELHRWRQPRGLSPEEVMERLLVVAPSACYTGPRLGDLP